MRKILTQLFTAILLSILVLAGEAATIPPDLNTAVVPVASQSPADLHQALVIALNQVLVKLSGNSQITALPGMTQQLANVEKFVQTYHYDGPTVQVTFDQHALITLLVQQKQRLWLSSRPKTLIWLSINGQPPQASPDNANAANNIFSTVAAKRAMPIIFPAMDPFDQELWNNQASSKSLDQPALQKLADHYRVNAVLVGQVSQKPDQSWEGFWYLLWHGQTWQWRNDGVADTILQSVVDKISDLMGSELSVNLDQQAANNLWLAVLGINDLADYSAVLTAVKQLQPVLGVVAQDVGSHGVLLKVTAIGNGPEALKNALDTNSHFAALPG